MNFPTIQPNQNFEYTIDFNNSLYHMDSSQQEIQKPFPLNRSPDQTKYDIQITKVDTSTFYQEQNFNKGIFQFPSENDNNEPQSNYNEILKKKKKIKRCRDTEEDYNYQKSKKIHNEQDSLQLNSQTQKLQDSQVDTQKKSNKKCTFQKVIEKFINYCLRTKKQEGDKAFRDFKQLLQIKDTGKVNFKNTKASQLLVIQEDKDTPQKKKLKKDRKKVLQEMILQDNAKEEVVVPQQVKEEWICKKCNKDGFYHRIGVKNRLEFEKDYGRQFDRLKEILQKEVIQECDFDKREKPRIKKNDQGQNQNQNEQQGNNKCKYGNYFYYD